MRATSLLATLAVLATEGSCARRLPDSAPAAPSEPTTAPLIVEHGALPAGALIEAGLDATIATDRSSRGERTSATFHAPVRDRAGHLLIAAGAKVILRITDLGPGKGALPAHLDLEAVAIRARCGQRLLEQPIEGEVEAADVEQIEEQARPNPARLGGLAGVIFGGLLLGIPGALGGYSLGAGGGTVERLAQRRLDARIAAGTVIQVRLQAPAPVRSLLCALPARARRAR